MEIFKIALKEYQKKYSKFNVVIYLSCILFFCCSKTIDYKSFNIKKFLKKDFLNNSLLLINIDTRSARSVDFTNKIFYYIELNNLKLDCFLVSLNKQLEGLKGKYKILDQSKLKQLKFVKNNYYLFNSKGNLLDNGILFGESAKLIKEIKELFLIKDKYEIDNFIKQDQKIEETILSKTIMDTYKNKRYSLYIIFEDICLACESGQALLEFEKLKKLYPEFGFNYISVFNYSDEEINRFKKNNNLKISILTAEKSLLNEWNLIKTISNTDHILKGYIFIVNQNGIIKFLSNKWDNFYDWLGSLNIKNMEGK